MNRLAIGRQFGPRRLKWPRRQPRPADRLIRHTARRLLHAALCAALCAVCATGMPREVTWDGASYLPVPVRIGSDTRLVMPEEFDDSWERDSEVAVTSLDATTLIIRPRIAAIDQRLTLRGRRSGTLYLARVSSALPYAPLVVVRSAQLARVDAPAGPGGAGADPAGDAAGAASAISVIGMLRAMIQGSAPAGFRVEHSTRVLLDQPPYRIVARQLWRSARISGIVADLNSTLAGRTLQVVPANLIIAIPELGTLRAAAPERYDLAPETPSTRLFLVYAR